MKKEFFVIVCLCLIVFQVFPEEDAITFSFDNAPMELTINVFAEIDFSTFPPPLGPMAEFIILPFAIKTGENTKNYLGFGAQGGAYLNFLNGLNILPVIAGVFVGRFTLSRTFILDMDARLGVMIGDIAVLYGGAGIGFKLFVPFDSRIYLGVEFTNNPYHDVFDQYSAEMLYNLVIGYGINILALGKK